MLTALKPQMQARAVTGNICMTLEFTIQRDKLPHTEVANFIKAACTRVELRIEVHQNKSEPRHSMSEEAFSTCEPETQQKVHQQQGEKLSKGMGYSGFERRIYTCRKERAARVHNSHIHSWGTEA